MLYSTPPRSEMNVKVAFLTDRKSLAAFFGPRSPYACGGVGRTTYLALIQTEIALQSSGSTVAQVSSPQALSEQECTETGPCPDIQI